MPQAKSREGQAVPQMKFRYRQNGEWKETDTDKLFNDGLDGNQRRSIDFFEGDKVDVPALKTLVRAAIAYNHAKLKKKAPVRKPVKQ